MSPQHAIEDSKISIIISLSGYPASKPFRFTVNVTNPIPTNASAVNKTMQVNTAGTGTLTLHYPDDFKVGPTPTTNLTGTYTVRITDSNLTTVLGATIPVPTSFTAGPTDELVYQRTLKVSIVAAGYTAGQNATVKLTQSGGSQVNGFPATVKINGTGFVTRVWNIPVNALLGTYTLNVTGPQPIAKPIADVQPITVNPAVLTISNLNTATSSGKIEANIVRGNTTFAVFNATYPNGTAVTNLTSTSSVSLVSPKGNTITPALSATYNFTLKGFFTRAGYRFPINAPTGNWAIRVSANATNDGNGNKGPLNNATISFAVGPLTLTTSIVALKTSYNRTTIFNVNASIMYPTSDPFNRTSGVVFANLTSGASPPAKQNLTYNPAINKWVGNITIPPDYPLGIATLRVSAYDKFGNTGSAATFTITVTPTTIIIRQISVNATTIKPLQTLALHINATYLNNQTLIPGPNGVGKITFLLPSGRSITIGLTKQQNGTLTGQYLIRDTDPLGAWNFTIGAGQLNDGNGNLNGKPLLGPTVTIIPIQLTFDSKLIIAPGNTIVTGDKFNVGVAFRYPNSTLAQNLAVNGTVFVSGKNMTFTFSFDSLAQKYVARIDTTEWAPGQYQLNVYAFVADYRGYQAIPLIVEPTPFLIGPLVGVALILIILALGVFEYRRRGGTESE